MNIWEDSIWKVFCFFCFWYLSIAWFVYYWRDEVIGFIFNFCFITRLTFLLVIFSVKWIAHCGSQYYIIRYRFHNDEEDTWRIIELPPIR